MAKSRNEAGRDMRRAGETTSTLKQASRRRESRSQERLKGGVGGGRWDTAELQLEWRVPV